MQYANIITQSPRSPTLPTRIPGTHNPDWITLHAAGWRNLDPRSDYAPPEGSRVSGYHYAQDDDREDWAIETPMTEVIPDPRPEVFPHGVEVGPGGLLVIPSHSTNAGILIFSDDDGNLLTAKVHGSPWLSKEEIKALKDAVKESAKAERDAYKALIAAIKADKKLDKATADAAGVLDEKIKDKLK